MLRRNSVSKIYLRPLHESKLDVKEITFKVPWGHVSGRVWNGSDSSRKPVLCLHGWKDNAATWDRLIPMLIPEVPNHQFWAIDLPGHGLSSHIPQGMMYDYKFTIMLVTRILNWQKWKTVTILGHSFGAQLGFLYSGLQPGVVEKFIAIDGLTPMVWSRDDAMTMISGLIQKHVEREEKWSKGKRPSHKYERILEIMLETHLGGMDTDSCKILMTRGIKETAKGSGLYTFAHDPRVQYMALSYLSHRQLSFVAKNFQSEVMYISADEGFKYMSPYLMDNIENWLRKRNKRSVRFVEVMGKHHCHLTTPETVFPFVFQILAK